MSVHHEKKSDRVSVHHEQKSDGVSVYHEKKSDGVRVPCYYPQGKVEAEKVEFQGTRRPSR